MIRCLPVPYPDELLWSVLARAGRRLHLSNPGVVFAEVIWGSRNFIASIDLPSGLESLCTALGPEHAGLDADTLMAKHTLLPAYAPFLWPDCLEAVKANMRTHGRGGVIHMETGIMASRVRQPSRMRSCPICDANDVSRYGEPYWHRCHQVPGVEVCPDHETFLNTTIVPRGDRRNRHAYISADYVSGLCPLNKVDKGSFVDDVLLRLARDFRWLMENRAWAQADALRKAYWEDLADLGLATYNRRLRLEMIQDELRSRYPMQLLERIQCAPDENGAFRWLPRLLRTRHAAASPIYHLLLMHFLGHTAESFFARLNSPGIFGTPGWPCRNPVCAHQGQIVITNCKIRHGERNRPVGTFKCPFCKYTYARFGPDRLKKEAGQVGWVKEYGERWKDALCKFWNDPSASLRKIAEKLEVDPLTIKRVALEIGLTFPREGKRLVNLESKESKIILTENFEKNRMDQRALWLSLATHHPSASKTELRRLSPGVFAWLYRHDHAWLSQNSPTSQKAAALTLGTRNWQFNDAAYSGQVSPVAEKMRLQPGRPKQITITAIAHQLGISAAIYKHPEKMPLTRAALKEFSESREQFAIRRIEYVASTEAWYSGQRVRWRLIRLSALRPDLVALRSISLALDLAVANSNPITSVISNQSVA